MDRRLKERLIGAAVLVAVGVWIIPWLLDGGQDPPELPADPLELPAPGEIAPVRFETLRLDAAPEEPIVPAPVVPEPMVADAAVSAVTVKPPREASEPAVEPVPVAAAPAPLREPAQPEPSASAEQAAAADAAWLVQLGAFGDAENAQRLADRVKGTGFDAEVSAFRSSGRTMQRVRVGPPATRARAEAAASALSAHGFVAQVVPVD